LPPLVAAGTPALSSETPATAYRVSLLGVPSRRMIAHNLQTRKGRRSMSARPVTVEPRHPALVEHAKVRQGSLQNRMADRITQLAGSMAFVYLHVLWFALRIAFRVEKFPLGLLIL
jgi:hypothetical protein